MTTRKTKILGVLLGAWVSTTQGYPCSIVGKVSNVEMVNNADVIVRARAVEYATPPSNPNLWTTGVPDSRIHFKVIERIRGPEMSELVLPGYLVDRAAVWRLCRLVFLPGRPIRQHPAHHRATGQARCEPRRSHRAHGHDDLAGRARLRPRQDVSRRPGRLLGRPHQLSDRTW